MASTEDKSVKEAAMADLNFEIAKLQTKITRLEARVAELESKNGVPIPVSEPEVKASDVLKFTVVCVNSSGKKTPYVFKNDGGRFSVNGHVFELKDPKNLGGLELEIYDEYIENLKTHEHSLVKASCATFWDGRFPDVCGDECMMALFDEFLIYMVTGLKLRELYEVENYSLGCGSKATTFPSTVSELAGYDFRVPIDGVY